MSEELSVEKVLDLKGLACPMPVVKVSKGIKEVEIGQLIEAHTTDPGSLTDFPAWARTSGNEIVKTEQEGDIIKGVVRRVELVDGRVAARPGVTGRAVQTVSPSGPVRVYLSHGPGLSRQVLVAQAEGHRDHVGDVGS